MKKISFLFLLIFSTATYAQKKEKIVVKQQDQVFFYRTGEFPDSIIKKNESDLFFLKMSEDKKATLEIRLKNATFLRTTDEFLFKLAYTPGMRYRCIYPVAEVASGQKNYNLKKGEQLPNKINIQVDGANEDGSKEIVIQLVDIKTEKVLLSNTFIYLEK